MKLVVGLGNPGREYEATRHNAGFWWVENLADLHRVPLQTEPKFFGRVGKLGTGPNDGWLLLPSSCVSLTGAPTDKRFPVQWRSTTHRLVGFWFWAAAADESTTAANAAIE